MELKLPENLYSIQDLKALIIEVRDYSLWFSQASIKQGVSKAKPSEPPVLSEGAEALLRPLQKENHFSQKDLDDLIEALEDLVDKSVVIKITLAAPPSVKLKTEIVAWCRKNISTEILVEFNFNSTMLGGLVVQYGSHIYDWSFRRQILASRSKFPEILRHV